MTTLSPEWTLDALCAEVDADIFFPEKGGSTKDAKGICAACPVRAECLEYALTAQVHGIWGGTNEKARQAIRRERGIHAPLLDLGTTDIYDAIATERRTA